MHCSEAPNRGPEVGEGEAMNFFIADARRKWVAASRIDISVVNYAFN